MKACATAGASDIESQRTFSCGVDTIGVGGAGRKVWTPMVVEVAVWHVV